MKCIATHPIQADALRPYFGKPLLALTHNGDVICGVANGVRDGKLILMPTDRPPTQLQALAVKRSMGRLAPGKKSKRVMLTPKRRGKVKLASYPAGGFGGFGGLGGFGGAGGYPGYPGYAGFGFGFAEGLAIAIPLFLLASLFAFPFFV